LKFDRIDAGRLYHPDHEKPQAGYQKREKHSLPLPFAFPLVTLTQGFFQSHRFVKAPPPSSTEPQAGYQKREKHSLPLPFAFPLVTLTQGFFQSVRKAQDARCLSSPSRTALNTADEKPYSFHAIQICLQNYYYLGKLATNRLKLRRIIYY
jgi:hypothetical protein